MSVFRFPNLIFRQLFEKESSTYTYLLADSRTNEGIIIDPVVNSVDRDLRLVEELNIKLLYAANTHVHADHVTGSGTIKQRVAGCKSVISAKSGAAADIHVTEQDEIKIGEFNLQVRNTPGHTKGCVTYILPTVRFAFTGDALLIRGCGRTDFQDGNPETLFNSVWREILSLPEDYVLFPAHDYTGRTITTVREERAYNPRLTKTLAEFIEIMNGLNLPPPQQINTAVPANMKCGFQ